MFHIFAEKLSLTLT